MILLIKWLATSAIVALIIILGAVWRVQSGYSDKIIAESQLGNSFRTAIIFGAGLNPDGTPRAILEARVIKGIELLKQRRVDRLLLTGATDKGHNEPEAMKTFAKNQGVKDEQLILDEKGDTTFDSCLNASIWVRRNLTPNNTILVSQKFHLARALYLCNNLGVNAVGIPARTDNSEVESAYARREYIASIKAWLQINLPFTRSYFENF